MASATLKLTVDPVTGKRTITISYSSDADALPHEHEDAHRQVVERLFEGGIAKPGDNIVVERGGVAAEAPGARSAEGAEQGGWGKEEVPEEQRAAEAERQRAREGS
jgi:hypothetical protein